MAWHSAMECQAVWCWLAVPVVHKPFELEELLAVVERAAARVRVS